LRKLQTMGSVAPVGGDGGAGQGLRVDAAAVAGGGGGRRGKVVKAAVAAGGIIFRWSSSPGRGTPSAASRKNHRFTNSDPWRSN